MTTINLVILGGSRAFGTAFPDCDWDYYGVFSYPLRQVVGLQPLRQSYQWQIGDNDFAFHELGKFVKLALKGNPTFLDVLYAPGVIYQDDTGAALRHIRYAFLSKEVLSCYVGYATDQLQRYERGSRLHSKTGGLNPKFISHALRLLYGGIHLAKTGEFITQLPLSVRNGIVALREGDPTRAIEAVATLRDSLVEEAKRTVLSEQPDTYLVEEFLWWARKRTLVWTLRRIDP
jgi:predicted nucleotidyltransferase